MGTITTVMTVEEFERLEDTPDELELLDGELIRVPPANRKHVKSSEQLFKLVTAAVESLHSRASNLMLGEVHMEMGYLLSPRSWLQPDVSLTHPEQPGERYYEGAPLIAFEIVSEHDTARDLDRKVGEYLAHGSAEVWVIYPETRHAQVYRAGAVTLESHAIRTDLLPAVEIPLDQIL